jgi:hypothetical protein
MSLSLLISSINMIVKGYFGVTLRLCLTKMVHRESDLGPNLLIGSESVLWFFFLFCFFLGFFLKYIVVFFIFFLFFVFNFFY